MKRDDLFQAHEKLVAIVIRGLSRKYPHLHEVDPESIARMALYEAASRHAEAREPFAGFAARMIRTRLQYALRKHSRRRRLAPRSARPLDTIPGPPVTDNAEKLHAALAHLPDVERKIMAWEFNLFNCRAQSPPMIAEKLGCSVADVQQKRKAALARLHEILDGVIEPASD